MKAIVIHAAEDLRIEERPFGAPTVGEVAIEMQAGGICGSDLHYYQHGGVGAGRVGEAMGLGDEGGGG